MSPLSTARTLLTTTWLDVPTRTPVRNIVIVPGPRIDTPLRPTMRIPALFTSVPEPVIEWPFRRIVIPSAATMRPSFAHARSWSSLRSDEIDIPHRSMATPGGATIVASANRDAIISPPSPMPPAFPRSANILSPVFRGNPPNGLTVAVPPFPLSFLIILSGRPRDGPPGTYGALAALGSRPFWPPKTALGHTEPYKGPPASRCPIGAGLSHAGARRFPHAQVPDRERRRIDLPRARARPQGDLPRPGRLRVRAGAVPRPHLPDQGTEDRDPAVPQRQGRLHGREEHREREDRDRDGREADRGGRHPDQEGPRDRGPEHRRHLGPRGPARPERGRGHPRPGGRRVRAGAVPRPRVPHHRAEGRPPHVRQREGRLHGGPEARGRREGDGEDHGRTQGERAPALIRPIRLGGGGWGYRPNAGLRASQAGGRTVSPLHHSHQIYVIGWDCSGGHADRYPRQEGPSPDPQRAAGGTRPDRGGPTRRGRRTGGNPPEDHRQVAVQGKSRSKVGKGGIS